MSAPLADLVRRGLSVDAGVLVVIDAAKGLAVGVAKSRPHPRTHPNPRVRGRTHRLVDSR